MPKINYKQIGKLMIDELPEGPLDRLVRSAWIGTKSHVSFEDFKEQYWIEHNARIEELDKSHPVEYDETFYFNEYESIHLFKRKDKPWSCYECNTAPNGSAGYINPKRGIAIIKQRGKNSDIKKVPESL